MSVEVALRLLAAVGLAAVIGCEREVDGQPAGLRTHITLALGACVFGLVSTLGFEEFFTRRELTNVQVDVTRVASNVVVGVGFLGAGLIFRQGGHVKNLTTAASLWATAGVGLAAGVGDPGMAAIATAAIVLTLVLLRPVRNWLDRHAVRPRAQVRATLAVGTDPASILALLQSEPGVTVERSVLLKDEGGLVVHAWLRARPGVDLGARLSALAPRADLVAVAVSPDE